MVEAAYRDACRDDEHLIGFRVACAARRHLPGSDLHVVEGAVRLPVALLKLTTSRAGSAAVARRTSRLGEGSPGAGHE